MEAVCSSGGIARTLRKDLHTIDAETGKTVVFATHDVAGADAAQMKADVFKTLENPGALAVN